MSGAGVAAVLLVGTRRELPTHATAWWLVLGVVAVGAGFELYEFLLKGFWHDWTLGVYATDTLLDLVVDALGAALVASLGAPTVSALDRGHRGDAEGARAVSRRGDRWNGRTRRGDGP